MEHTDEVLEIIHEWLYLRQKRLFRQLDITPAGMTKERIRGKLRENQRMKKKLHNFKEMENDITTMKLKEKENRDD